MPKCSHCDNPSCNGVDCYYKDEPAMSERELTNIYEILADLRKQATVERSHFYVASVIDKSVAELHSRDTELAALRKELAESKKDCEAFEFHLTSTEDELKGAWAERDELLKEARGLLRKFDLIDKILLASIPDHQITDLEVVSLRALCNYREDGNLQFLNSHPAPESQEKEKS